MVEGPVGSLGVIEYRRPGIGRARRHRSFGEEISKVAALAALFVYYGLRMSREKGADVYFFAGVVLWLAICLATVARRWWRGGDASSQRPISVGWRVAVALLLVATLASFIVPFHSRGRYTCPHGMRWANNQLGIAWSDNGGPCGNGPYQRVGRSWRIAKHWYVYRPREW